MSKINSTVLQVYGLQSILNMYLLNECMPWYEEVERVMLTLFYAFLDPDYFCILMCGLGF